MLKEIIPIPLKQGIAAVNCYLLRLDTGFILIDTGFTKRRTELKEMLENAGCKPGDLHLIVLTHGDFDHIGNCRYIRDTYKTKIAMHVDDVGMAEKGDMFWNRKKTNGVLKFIAKLLFKLESTDRFIPDILLKDGDDLSKYGITAEVITIPGHSKGSIGVLTFEGNLFCGDFFENGKKAKVNRIMDNRDAAKASMEKIRNFKIDRIFPGHGNPFLMEEFNGLYR